MLLCKTLNRLFVVYMKSSIFHNKFFLLILSSGGVCSSSFDISEKDGVGDVPGV